MDINIISVVLSSLGTGTIVGGAILWFIRSNFGNVVNIAVLTERINKQDIIIAEVKTEMGKIVGNYNSKFDAMREHMTREVDRVIIRMEEDRAVVQQLQINCAANHGVGQ